MGLYVVWHGPGIIAFLFFSSFQKWCVWKHFLLIRPIRMCDMQVILNNDHSFTWTSQEGMFRFTYRLTPSFFQPKGYEYPSAAWIMGARLPTFRRCDRLSSLTHCRNSGHCRCSRCELCFFSRSLTAIAGRSLINVKPNLEAWAMCLSSSLDNTSSRRLSQT